MERQIKPLGNSLMVGGFRDNIGVEKLSSRQVLALNLAAAMERSADMQTNVALAKRAKVGHSHIGRILKCTTGATVDMLDSIAGALGVMPWELLTDSETTRQAAMAKMLWGARVSNDEVEKHFPIPAPNKKPRKRKRKDRP